MGGLPWFKVASDFPGHPKTHRLCVLLGDSNAGMYVIRLLAYCATYAPDGRVPLDMLKQAAGWTKQRSSVELLTSSLVQAGFMVCTETHAEIHGWEEWNGAHVRKCAKDNARPRSDYRVPRAGTSRDPRGNLSGSRAGDVEGEKIEIQKQLPCAEKGSAPAGPVVESPRQPPQQTTANGAARAPGRAGNGRAAPKPDADPRHAVFIAAAHRLYAAKVPGGNLTVNGKDGTHLRDFLACQPKVGLEQFETVYLAALGLGGKWPGCTRVADVVDRWTDLLALTTGPPAKLRAIAPAEPHENFTTRKVNL